MLAGKVVTASILLWFDSRQAGPLPHVQGEVHMGTLFTGLHLW